MPFDIVHIGDVTLAGGAVVPGMIIQSHYATVEGIQFDATEPDNTLGADGVIDSKVAQYGYNRYSESGYRAWLNSRKKAGEWFETTFERNGETLTRREADVAPSQLNQYSGFMAGFDEEFLSILKPTQIATACNTSTDGGVIDTTYDTFFLPSLENICVTSAATAGSEGGNWDYWAQRVGINARAINQPFERGITYALEKHTSAQEVRLRSVQSFNAYNGYILFKDGRAIGGGAVSGFQRCAPACVIC
jgi:hypothetical protein